MDEEEEWMNPDKKQEKRICEFGGWEIDFGGGFTMGRAIRGMLAKRNSRKSSCNHLFRTKYVTTSFDLASAKARGL